MVYGYSFEKQIKKCMRARDWVKDAAGTSSSWSTINLVSGKLTTILKRFVLIREVYCHGHKNIFYYRLFLYTKINKYINENAR